jgi:hypothetical protein
VNACFNNDGVGDDEFTFIITGKGAVLLSRRHQIDTSHIEHTPFTGNMLWFHIRIGNTESFHQHQTLAQSGNYCDIVCKVSEVRVIDGKETKWFITEERIG